MQEKCSWMNYTYEIYRTNAEGGSTLLATIHRHWTMFSFTDNYSIELSPMVALPPITCHGRWPNKFTLTCGGRAVATVFKKNFSWSDKYKVMVLPGMDVLLTVAIACGIDRIHHEVEDERRRREEMERGMEDMGRKIFE